MNNGEIIEVERLMSELQQRINALRARENAHKDAYFGSKYTAAIRRTSMDLTRALAVLRGRAS